MSVLWIPGLISNTMILVVSTFPNDPPLLLQQINASEHSILEFLV